ncbi:unnamed protein product [Coregonus sp. 'balchen']|nr:unnamed protein product [Coregonus sp. 'balchen']
MEKNERSTHIPGKDKEVDIINIKGIEDIGYVQPDSILLNSLTPEENTGCQHGLYFQDGERRVDYILTYHIKKPSSSRSNRQSSRFTDNAFTRSLRRGTARLGRPPPPQSRGDREVASQDHSMDYHEDDKRFRREEFEGNLRDMGLELEKDEDTKTPSVGFVKIHAPWHVYEVKQCTGVGAKINTLVNKATEPLHPNVEENRAQNLLYEEWASYSVFYKYQPIGLVRKYFGEKIGLYFAWLGLYTQMLIPASLVGVIVFLYGCATVDDNIPSMEICHPRNNITMCPLCDRACSYWKLKEACGTARASHLFDNPATVFFSIFMALWAAMFMEHWKRRQMRLNYEWDLTGFEEEEDHPRAEYEFRVMQKSLKKEHKTQKTEKEKLTCRDRLPAYMINIVMMLLMIGVTFAIVFGVILYRISTKAALHMSNNPTTRSNVRLTVKTTAAIINLVVILILDEVYGAVARWLTVLEVPKTDKSFEERLIFKTFILKFVNAFTPIIYIAFFRGRLVGRPGSYLYVFESYRMEECAHGGCLMELCIQLSITMLGKQLIQNNLFEIGIPSFQEEEREKKLQRYETDHFLEPFAGLTPEYMEMRIWYNLLRGVAKVAVIINAFVISFTSDFIPRLVYQYMYSPDGSMHGFVNHTMSYFNVSDFQDGKQPMDPLHLGYQVEMCRYKDYRDPPWSNTPYVISKEFWAVLAARLAFNVVMLMSDIVDWLIPDIPKDISLQIHKEKILMVELFMKEEQGKRQFIDSMTSCDGKEKRNNHTPIARSHSIPHTHSHTHANNF